MFNHSDRLSLETFLPGRTVNLLTPRPVFLAVCQTAMAQTTCVSFPQFGLHKGWRTPRRKFPADVRLVWISPRLPGLTFGWDRKKASTVKPEWCQLLFSRWGSGTMQATPTIAQHFALLFPATGSLMSELTSAAQPSRIKKHFSICLDGSVTFCEQRSPQLFPDEQCMLSTSTVTHALRPSKHHSGGRNLDSFNGRWSLFAKFLYFGTGKLQRACHETKLCSYVSIFFLHLGI